MDATNVALGVCTVTFDSVNLGHTKGGVEFTYEPTWHDVTVDYYGESVVRKRLMGEKAMAKVPLAEYTIANAKIAIPAGTVAGAGDERVEVGSSAGKSSDDLAAELVLVPVDATGNEHTITIHKAMVANAITISHVNDAERVLECEFHALIDESNSDGNYLFSIGDTAT